MFNEVVILEQCNSPKSALGTAPEHRNTQAPLRVHRHLPDARSLREISKQPPGEPNKHGVQPVGFGIVGVALASLLNSARRPQTTAAA